MNHELAAEYKRGDRIHARWAADGKTYHATYLGKNKDGTHRIKWDDGGAVENTDHVRHRARAKAKAARPAAVRKPRPAPPPPPPPVAPAPRPSLPPAEPHARRLPSIHAPIVQPMTKDKTANPYGDDYLVRDGQNSSFVGHIKQHGAGHFTAHHLSGTSREFYNTTLEHTAQGLVDYHRQVQHA